MSHNCWSHLMYFTEGRHYSVMWPNVNELRWPDLPNATCSLIFIRIHNFLYRKWNTPKEQMFYVKNLVNHLIFEPSQPFLCCLKWSCEMSCDSASHSFPTLLSEPELQSNSAELLPLPTSRYPLIHSTVYSFSIIFCHFKNLFIFYLSIHHLPTYLKYSATY